MRRSVCARAPRTADLYHYVQRVWRMGSERASERDEWRTAPLLHFYTGKRRRRRRRRVHYRGRRGAVGSTTYTANKLAHMLDVDVDSEREEQVLAATSLIDRGNRLARIASSHLVMMMNRERMPNTDFNICMIASLSFLTIASGGKGKNNFPADMALGNNSFL